MGECRNDLVALEVIKLARVIESAPVGLGKGEMQCKPTGGMGCIGAKLFTLPPETYG